MAKIISFPEKPPKKPSKERKATSSATLTQIKAAKKKARAGANTLCREGHHKWQVIKDSQFDVKQGRLITSYRCKHCGKTRTRAER